MGVLDALVRLDQTQGGSRYQQGIDRFGTSLDKMSEYAARRNMKKAGAEMMSALSAGGPKALDASALSDIIKRNNLNPQQMLSALQMVKGFKDFMQQKLYEHDPSKNVYSVDSFGVPTGEPILRAAPAQPEKPTYKAGINRATGKPGFFTPTEEGGAAWLKDVEPIPSGSGKTPADILKQDLAKRYDTLRKQLYSIESGQHTYIKSKHKDAVVKEIRKALDMLRTEWERNSFDIDELGYSYLSDADAIRILEENDGDPERAAEQARREGFYVPPWSPEE